MIGNTPMVKMPDADIKRLRVLILRACLGKDGKNKEELLTGKELEDFPKRYVEQTIMETVRGLSRTGLLYSKGNTRGTLYFTTKEGQNALERFEQELEDETDE